MPDETSAEGLRDASEAAEARNAQFLVILAALGDMAFTGAVAVHVAFADTSPAAAVAVTASAAVFVVATIVALVARRRSIMIVATSLIAVAGLAAAVAAVDAGRRYGALRDEAAVEGSGPRLLETDGAHRRLRDGAMLSSISATLAAVTALPLAGVLAVRIRRSPDRTP